MRSLAELAPGESARLAADIRPSPRLASLGFVAGTEVRVVRLAPFGDPIEFEIRGARLCLRAEQVAGLAVEPLDPAEPLKVREPLVR